jgi:ATP-binding cassette subfamily B protein
MIFSHFPQLDAMDCGATCLRMISKFYGKSYSNQFLREKSFITREGVSMLGIADAAESIGFRTQGVKISLEQLLKTPLPTILHLLIKRYYNLSDEHSLAQNLRELKALLD